MFEFLRWWFKDSSRVRPGTTKVRKRQSQPRLEMLEDRCVPAVFNVNSVADILNPPTGVVTPRSAIEAANATPGGTHHQPDRPRHLLDHFAGDAWGRVR